MRAAISVILDSVSFLRRYPFLMIFSLICILLNQLAIWSAANQVVMVRYATETVSWLFGIFVELIVCLFVYKVKGVLPQGSALFEIVKMHFPKALRIFIVGGILTILSALVFGLPFICLIAFLSVEFPFFLFWVLFFISLFLWIGFVSLGIRLMVFNNHETALGLVKLGLHELNRNLHFYFQVFLGSILLALIVDFLVYFILALFPSRDTSMVLATAHRLSAAINLPLVNIIITLAFLRKNFGWKENA